MNVIESYAARIESENGKFRQYALLHNVVTVARLLIAFAIAIMLHKAFGRGHPTIIWAWMVLSALAFLALMRLGHRISDKKKGFQAMVTLNEQEKDFLEKGAMPFAQGPDGVPSDHPYANDLDIVGDRSLYQYLNRTKTFPGEQELARLLLDPLSAIDDIKEHQEAVKELGKDIDFRQRLMAQGMLASDGPEVYKRILQWCAEPMQPFSKLVQAVSLLLATALVLALSLYALLREPVYWTWATRLFPLNLVWMSFLLKKIKKGGASADKMKEALDHYAAMIALIEQHRFAAPKLVALSRSLHKDGKPASKHLYRLSRLNEELESVYNPFSFVLMDGLLCYHVFAYQKMAAWKKKYAAYIQEWLSVIGQLETLGSLGNFHYNFPEHAFPVVSGNGPIRFRDLGHPLIPAEKRIGNDIAFDEQRFVILTGSNMSGKSTFLRSLGVNMVLGCIGAPVCASQAHIRPMPLLVTMRLSDSLSHQESYFFAEVKRLKSIMDQVQERPCFLLLDEILRGTNSEDKRSGTLAIIDRIIQTEAYGLIATHDLEVCQSSEAHPDVLANKCFEVSIVDNDLVFDYRLRPGVCRNKSATFLMQKMGVIP